MSVFGTRYLQCRIKGTKINSRKFKLNKKYKIPHQATEKGLKSGLNSQNK